MEGAMNDSYAPYVDVDLPTRRRQTAEERRWPRPSRSAPIAMVGAALIVLPFVLYAGAAFFIPLF
jgi:hypothetical protein